MITARDLQTKLSALLPEARIRDVTQEVPFVVELGDKIVEFSIPIEELMDLSLDLLADMYLDPIAFELRA